MWASSNPRRDEAAVRVDDLVRARPDVAAADGGDAARLDPHGQRPAAAEDARPLTIASDPAMAADAIGIAGMASG